MYNQTSHFIKQIKYTYFSILIGISILLGLSNCRKENILTDSSAKIEFSKDTVVFDTVFTTIGSTYRRFTVFNPQSNPVVLSNVRLGKGTASEFRINVDGLAGTNITDVEILPKDSVYVFVEVTIDPTTGLLPFVVEDDIFFTLNGNTSNVHLLAWGQDAYFHVNELVCGETWTDDKPHVIYGIAAVGFPGLDSNCTLTINQGARIYAHYGGVLYVYKSKLIVNGTQTNKVIFEGDRREASFADEPGQWFGIRFAIAQNSEITHAIIKNGTAGIYADTAFGGATSGDIIKLDKVESTNHSFASLFAQGAHIEAENCLFTNSGTNSVALRLGGNYFLNHCTIGNYYSKSARTSPAMILNNYYEVGNTVFVRPFVNADIHNSIIYGNNDNELTLDTIPGFGATYLFNHCFIKTEEPLNSRFVNVNKNVDPQFTSTDRMEISTSSSTRGAADINFPLFVDLDENSRNSPAAVGCFENL
ncbi:MAG: hypothetical protein ABF240_08865 [Flavobacteriales bacterium]